MNAVPESPESRAAAKAATSATLKAAGKPAKATEPEARTLKPIHKSKAHLADQRRNHWVVYVGEDIRPADLEDPALWSSVAQDWQLGDRIEVHGVAYWAECLVFDVAPGYAALRLVTTVQLPPRRGGPGLRVPLGFRIDPPAPGDAGWKIIRENDSFHFNKGQSHRTQLEALSYLVGHAALRN